MALEDHIKQWVLTDNQMKLYQEKVKDLRDQRNLLSEDILEFAKKNNLDNATIQISDGKLKFQTIKINEPLTFKFIKQCLEDCFESSKQVEQLITYIKEKRTTKYVKDIKRFYKRD